MEDLGTRLLILGHLIKLHSCMYMQLQDFPVIAHHYHLPLEPYSRAQVRDYLDLQNINLSTIHIVHMYSVVQMF